MKQIEYLLASAPAAASSAGSTAAATARPAGANPGPPPAPTRRLSVLEVKAAVDTVQGAPEVLAEVPKKAKKPKKKKGKTAKAAPVWPPTREFEEVEYDDIIAKVRCFLFFEMLTFMRILLTI